MSDTKTCRKCGTVKPLEAFGIDRSRKTGLTFYCRACDNAARTKRRQDSRENLRLARLHWAWLCRTDPERAEREVRAAANPAIEQGEARATLESPVSISTAE